MGSIASSMPQWVEARRLMWRSSTVCTWLSGQDGLCLRDRRGQLLGSIRQRQAELYPAFAAANSYDGRLYALPFRADVSLLWYRQDWFAQEGIAPPRDWDDLRHVAEHFSKPAVKASYGLEAPLAFPGGRAGGESTVYSLMPFVGRLAADVFQDDVVVSGGPGTRLALAFLRSGGAGWTQSPDVTFFQWSTAPWMFAKGKVAMSLGGSYETDFIMDASGWTREEFMRARWLRGATCRARRRSC